MMGRLTSPYDMPFDLENPLKPVLKECIDFKAIQSGPIKVFVTATNVRTGRGKIFRDKEITPDALLASACLPTLFKSVIIDGEAYWDGGYSGNPTLTPLIRECDSDDTILVQLNPIERDEIPTKSYNILSRLNEISFNSVLQQELRMMSLLRRATPEDDGEGGLWGRQRLHRISSDFMLKLGYSSKLNAEWDFLKMLCDEGRSAADAFLAQSYDQIGVTSTLDIDKLLAGVDE
jgi:NTE family protein